jgi:hypothetical protein
MPILGNGRFLPLQPKPNVILIGREQYVLDLVVLGRVHLFVKLFKQEYLCSRSAFFFGQIMG